jgi:hypothetical protein
VDQRRQSEVVLRPGLTIALARDLALHVVEVVTPDAGLALEDDGLPRQVLAGTCSLQVHPLPRLEPRYVGEASAWIWSTGEAWRILVGNSPATVLAAGDTLTIDGKIFRAVAVVGREPGALAPQAPRRPDSIRSRAVGRQRPLGARALRRRRGRRPDLKTGVP